MSNSIQTPYVYHLLLMEGPKVQRSRSQARAVYVFPQIHFRKKTLVWINSLYLNLTNISPLIQGRPLSIWFKRSMVMVKVTGQSSLHPASNYFRMITPIWIKQLYSNLTYLSRTIQGRPLLILGQKDKGKGHRGRFVSW